MPGRHYEDFRVGEVIEHALRRTITEADNVLFCSLTLNTQPLHLDEEYARGTPFGRRLVNGLLTLALAVGISVRDTTEGTLVANLGYAKVEHPKPVFHGDTLRVQTKVLSMRRTSKPDRGLVEMEHSVFNQGGEVVCRFTRTALVQVRHPEKAEAAA
ncbi:MAG TPA: MaoC family dehydratase [Candidatus Thermoplasmatota archaeon]|nr:MaoC family dehydratase [Candidatus Thermoplasmatota archaeon]